MSGPAARRTGISDHFSRVCGFSALGILALIIVLVILERNDIEKTFVARLAVLGLFALYAGIGLLSIASAQADYHLEGGVISAVFAGLAGGAVWSAAAIVMSTGGSLPLAGYDSRSLLIGLTGGYVLLAALIAPFLRNLGVAAVPEFMGARYGGAARVLAQVVLLVCSSLFLVAVLQAAIPVLVSVFGINDDTALAILLVLIVMCALRGGAYGITATQIGQYIALIIGGAALFLMVEAYSFNRPSGTTYDPIIEALEAMVRGLGLAPVASPRSVPFRVSDALGDLELTVSLMAGTATLPHVLLPPLSTPNMGEARRSVAWSLLFIAGLVFVLPTYVAHSSAEVYREPSGVAAGLVAAIGLSAMLAAASALLLLIANSLDRGIPGRSSVPATAPSPTLTTARALLIAAAAFAAYLVKTLPMEPSNWMAWAFSLAAAGFFPALVLGIWWKRATAGGAICGITVGFGLCLFYIAVSRYFRQLGVTRLGMSPLLNSGDEQALVNVTQVLADPRWSADVPASEANPLASRVGWLNVGNTVCGILGVFAGFAITIGVSLLGGRPSARTQVFVDSLHAPRHHESVAAAS
jgi:cation/acetate symporter